MATYTQANRPLKISTPLGKDQLLLVGLEGHEAISELFHFQLDLLAVRGASIPFDRILGQNVTVELALPGGRKRFFNGIIRRLTQGRRDTHFVDFRAELVPQFWLWTKRVQSRIFQHVAVPEILKQVLTGLNVKFEIQGTYHPRDYCAQYRESDFAFASRLMEEEGIHYFFKHADGSHQMIVTDAAGRHPDLEPTSAVIYDEVAGGLRDEDRVTDWEKSQELRAGQYTLWDHCFELPGKKLEARQPTLDSVAVGTVTHRLKLGSTEPLEIYDYPGGYAQRFDGVDKGGAVRAADLENIFADNQRTVRLRMEQEALPALAIRGQGTCRHFTPGYRFTLSRHFDADGPYVLTRVEHNACLAGAYRSGDEAVFTYENRFTCIPVALPYRPPQVTPRPTMGGTQTATVVGPAGEEIFCDKYGRVKVQFHWDRHGKNDAGSSCWVRVAQPWAGGGFGSIALPRVGHEVVVDFLEGDPDQPLILGGVYNAGKMPPFKLPEHRMFSGLKSNSVRGQVTKNFSGLAFNDTTGDERVALYAEKNMMVNAEHDHKHHVGHYQHTQIGHMSLTTVGGIPGGGGSGGGGGDTNLTTGATTTTSKDSAGNLQQTPDDPSYGNWKTSNGLLSAQPGMAGAVIYGVNSQDTVGFMHQVTIGAAYQICFDPLGFFGFIPNPAAGGAAFGLLGAIGGNVQVTFGMNTQAVYGPAITINHGPQISFTDQPWTLTYVLAPLVPALSLAYELGFGAMYGSDDQASSRSNLYAGSVAVIAAANAALLASETFDRATKLAAKAISATVVDALLLSCLGMADSKSLPDFMKKKIHDGKLTAQAVKPDDPLSPLDDANSLTVVQGVLYQTAKHIHLIAAKDPTETPPDPNPSTIYINAAGKGTDGVAFINATKGMTLSSGAAIVELVNTAPTNGEVSVQCGLQGKITLSRMPEMAKPQMIQMSPTTILIDGGMTPPAPIKLLTTPLVSVELDPKAGITLQCGPNKITIGPQGVIIDALNITLKAMVKIGKKALLHSVEATMSDHNFSFHTIK